jgi:DNA-binding winged helix-turn-helix (wHTH) protein
VTYFFGEHQLDTTVLELRRHGQKLPLKQLGFRLLLHLIQRRPAAVSKEELVREVWKGVHVVDGAIRTAACDLRRMLGQEGAEGPWIQTVPGFGYRFVGRVREGSAPPWPAVESTLIQGWDETDPDAAISELLEACREALEQGRRDVFGARLIRIVGIWMEARWQSVPADYRRSFSLRDPSAERTLC